MASALRGLSDAGLGRFLRPFFDLSDSTPPTKAYILALWRVNDYNAVIDLWRPCMAVMTIRNIDEAIKKRLRVRAAVNGRSMEDEARDILRSALSTDVVGPRDLGQAISERFRKLGGVELPEVSREAIRQPQDFGA
jgi:plasmid stability protein